VRESSTGEDVNYEAEEATALEACYQTKGEDTTG
jgi:hypothetical protein